VPISTAKRWPDAAYGENGKAWRFEASSWPTRGRYEHLSDILTTDRLKPLSYRAARGFLERARRSRLRFDPDFIRDVEQHVALGNGQSMIRFDESEQGLVALAR
jgi:DNA (cytosine-5)-methyltransferase 1